MTPCSFLGSYNWYICPTCASSVAGGTHQCTGARVQLADQTVMRLSDEDIERIAQRVAELVSPKRRSAEQ